MPRNDSAQWVQGALAVHVSAASGSSHAGLAALGAGLAEVVHLSGQFSQAGWALVQLADGSLLASRWGHARALPCLASARRFLAQVGGCT